MSSVTLSSSAVASSGALSLQSNGTTEAIGISTGQVATLAQNPILTSGTANGVAYLNGSKVLTTGSALVFDGTNLGVGITPSTWNVGKTLELGSAVGNAVNGQGANDLEIVSNAYYNSGFKFAGTGYANRLDVGSAAGAFKFFVSNASGTAGNAITWTQAMTLDASGNLILGATAMGTGGISGFRLNGASSIGTTYAIGGADKGFVYASSGASRLQLETANGYTIAVVSGGSAGVSLANGGTSWGSLSDGRRKDIIEPIKDASHKVSTLRAVIGKYKTDDASSRRAFLIAQDVQAVLPEAVVEDASGDLILQYTDTIPLLVAAIKEQQTIITELNQRLTALETK